jgi:transcriptional regulator with XRE-family HTH domain
MWNRRATVRALRVEQERLGARLRALRLERELTIERAAEKSGLNATYVARLERGGSNATLGVLVALAKVYRITVDDIFRDHPLQAVNPRPTTNRGKKGVEASKQHASAKRRRSAS